MQDSELFFTHVVVEDVLGMVTFPLNFIFITLFKIIPSQKCFQQV